MRDALNGLTRFDEFQKSLGIAPNMLTRRLNALVEAGLLERRNYQQRPPRHEYMLTDRGRDFRSVVVSLLAWGNRHFASEGKSVIMIDVATGLEAEPILIDAISGRPINEFRFRYAAGPEANERIRRLYVQKNGSDPGDEGAQE